MRGGAGLVCGRALRVPRVWALRSGLGPACNRAKRLLDPYARSIDGNLAWRPSWRGYDGVQSVAGPDRFRSRRRHGRLSVAVETLPRSSTSGPHWPTRSSTRPTSRASRGSILRCLWNCAAPLPASRRRQSPLIASAPRRHGDRTAPRPSVADRRLAADDGRVNYGATRRSASLLCNGNTAPSAGRAARWQRDRGVRADGGGAALSVVSR